MTTMAATSRGAGLVRSTTTVTRRALLRYVRTPQLIVMATLQMTMFFLIYRYLFGGAIHIAGLPYVDYLVPGFIATGVLFSGIGAAVATAEDLQQGFIDRLRSLPIARSSVLTARAIADTLILALAAAVTVAIAFAVGFRLHGSAIDGVAAFGLVIAFGFAFEWLFITHGAVRRQRPGRAGDGDDRVPVRVYLERVHPRRHDARVAAGVRQAPAAHLHGRRDAGPHPGSTRPSAAGPPGGVLHHSRVDLGTGDRRGVTAGCGGTVSPRLVSAQR